MTVEFASIHLIALIAGYLIGSVPFGLVLTRLAGMGDIRDIGSGNIGATNVLRTGNKPLALATLLLDSGKGAIAALILGSFDPLAGLIGGGAAILGHNFPVWLKFKGGKGVATTLGVLIAVAWPVGLAACVTWLASALLFRYSSLAALVALAASPFYAWWLASPEVATLAAGLAILSAIRHHENITRLLKGEESKIAKKKT
jgi:acyl phosphate:glycerol-3-phosphate acyltransferase